MPEANYPKSQVREKLFDRLIKFALLRPRSEKEIKNWLSRKKVTPEDYLDYFTKLKRMELVDDQKFTFWWIDQRMSFRPRSRRELKAELLKKGIARSLIEETLAKVNIDELKIAQGLLAQKGHRFQKFGSSKVKEKLAAYLARKGFSWEIIKTAIDEFGQKS